MPEIIINDESNPKTLPFIVIHPFVSSEATSAYAWLPKSKS